MNKLLFFIVLIVTLFTVHDSFSKERKLLSISDYNVVTTCFSSVKNNIGNDEFLAECDYGTLIFQHKNNSWDFSKYVFLTIEIENKGISDGRLEVRLNNDFWSTGFTVLPPKSYKQFKSLIVRKKYTKEQLEFFPQMAGLPGGATKLWCSYEADSIHTFSLHFQRINKGDRFIIRKIMLEEPYKEFTSKEVKAMMPLVDEFGQNCHKKYDGKISKVSELLIIDKNEESDLDNNPQNTSWNQFGGWKKGPRLHVTGHFRVEKYKNKWWFVDPEGYLFWSHGIDCVGGFDHTNVIGREHLFTYIPEKNDRNKRFVASTNNDYQISYYGLNLDRKWGEDFNQKRIDKTIRRLWSWQVNTIANWSDQEIIKQKKVPYTATIYTSNGFPSDPFDKSFKDNIESQLKSSQAKHDSWCIGYFVDNELHWHDLAERTISGYYPKAKIEMMHYLQNKYKSILKLNAIWKSNFKDWSDFLENRTISQDSKNDLLEFSSIFAKAYFQVCKEAIQKFAPNKLYLGCRFNYGDYHGNIVQRTTVEAAASYCDVVSFNRYAYGASSLTSGEHADFPMIIGEFHFGALDRGLLHGGLRFATDQKDRALLYKSYVEDCVKNPNIIGSHWFQYLDQALTGRGDGENYDIGFVDVLDKPKIELVNAAREVGRSMYEIRFND